MKKMKAYFKSELLKQKRNFSIVLLWTAPLATILLAFALMGGMNLQSGAYNWWYMLVLPSCFTMCSSFITTKECRKNRHGFFGIAIQKSRLWMAQVLVSTLFLLITCMFFFVFITIGGILFEKTIPVFDSLFTSIVLFMTFSWQIPLWMWLAQKFGALLTLSVSLGCNFIFPVIYSDGNLWRIPFAIPARLMCACIRVLPNGLQVEKGNLLEDKGVIWQGILIATVLYILITKLTAYWYEKCEV